MSDLISRNDLLKKFNDIGIHIEFDLPVEEVLGEDVDIDDFTMLVQDAIQAYRNMVIGTIKEQPTAFDAEKFVKQLEEEEEYSYADFEEYAESYGLDLSEHDDWYCQGLKRAITLAKRGIVK